MKKIIFIFGTRPEAIKVIPVIKYFKEQNVFDVKIINTGQHKELLDEVLEEYQIVPDYNLEIIKEATDLVSLNALILSKAQAIYKIEKPDVVLVHGDTVSCLAGGMAAFYENIAVGHIEAGLRSYDLYAPFPEEFNRQVIDRISKYNFAPTQIAANNIVSEKNDAKKVYIVGNSIMDAIKDKFDKNDESEKNHVLVTAHRRESIGKEMEQIADALVELATKYPHLSFTLPLHKNPKVREIFVTKLSKVNNFVLTEHLDHSQLINLIKKSKIILTDSGGIQEEAIAFQVPTLVLRETTERPEGLDIGILQLTGYDKDKIVTLFEDTINSNVDFKKVENPYGNGNTSQLIHNILKEDLIDEKE